MTDIRRRPDGSIDTTHYIAHGRARRSAAAYVLIARLAAWVQRHRRRPNQARPPVQAWPANNPTLAS